MNADCLSVVLDQVQFHYSVLVSCSSNLGGPSTDFSYLIDLAIMCLLTRVDALQPFLSLQRSRVFFFCQKDSHMSLAREEKISLRRLSFGGLAEP